MEIVIVASLRLKHERGKRLISLEEFDEHVHTKIFLAYRNLIPSTILFHNERSEPTVPSHRTKGLNQLFSNLHLSLQDSFNNVLTSVLEDRY